eukprot:Rmarinus@m.11846
MAFRMEMGRLLFLYFTLCVQRLRGEVDLSFALENGLLTRSELKSLQIHSTAAFVVMEWITEQWVTVSECYHKEKQDSDPRVSVRLAAPIVANTFRNLSEIQFHFNEARKLRETPFPFPYVQMVALLLVAMVATMPIVLAAYVPDLVFGPALTFLTALSLLSVNEVAAEIENPFGSYENDLPLNYFLGEFHADLVAFGLLRPLEYKRADVEAGQCAHTIYVPAAADESASAVVPFLDLDVFGSTAPLSFVEEHVRHTDLKPPNTKIPTHNLPTYTKTPTHDLLSSPEAQGMGSWGESASWSRRDPRLVEVTKDEWTEP